MVEVDACTGDLGDGAASGAGCCRAGLTNASGDGSTAVTTSGAGAGDMVTVIVATGSGSAATNMPS